jgi:hypothetical protein
VPVGNVLVGDTGGNIEHDDTGLTVDVVTITETTELLLTGGIPDIELNGSQVLSHRSVSRPSSERGFRRGIAYGSEGEGVNFDTESGDVLLLEFTSQVALDESGLLGWLR